VATSLQQFYWSTLSLLSGSQHNWHFYKILSFPGLATRGEKFCCKHGVQHSKSTNWTLTYVVSPCDNTPAPVEVWAEYRWEMDSGTCKEAFTDCCLQFDHASWSERITRRQRRKERRHRRRQNRRQEAKTGLAAAEVPAAVGVRTSAP